MYFKGDIMTEEQQIQQRNRCIKIIQKKYQVGYARAAHIFMIIYNTPMFVVKK